MNTATIYVHDPYDVFLGVGFGFCYASALVPAVRMMSKLKKEIATLPKNTQLLSVTWLKARCKEDWRMCVIRTIVLARGMLTVLGLACLYGWYSMYFKTVYNEELPIQRQLLDWFSLGLFAIGANCWDNEDHHEILYCFIQTAAVAAFGLTCWLAIPAQPLQLHQPLIKGVFWCTVVTSSLLCHIAYSQVVDAVYSSRFSDRKRSVLSWVCGFGFLALFALLAWGTFYIVGISKYLGDLLGVVSYVSAGALFVAVVVTTILTENKDNRERVKSILVTLVPMLILTCLTWRNRAILFQHN